MMPEIGYSGCQREEPRRLGSLPFNFPLYFFAGTQPQPHSVFGVVALGSFFALPTILVSSFLSWLPFPGPGKGSFRYIEFISPNSLPLRQNTDMKWWPSYLGPFPPVFYLTGPVGIAAGLLGSWLTP